MKTKGKRPIDETIGSHPYENGNTLPPPPPPTTKYFRLKDRYKEDMR
jgi:hypothetical protein